jgi:hypothetical protein
MKPWKIQKFASDVIYDLRTRNMLSIAIVLVLGIFLVPIMISMTSGSSEPAPSGGLTAGDPADLAPEGQAAVLAYNPGVRNYKRRLDSLSAANPFIQQYTDSGGGGDTGGELGGTTEAGGTGSGGSGDSGGSGGSDGSSGGKTKVKTKTKTKFYVFETDVRIGESGGELIERNNIDQFEFLPDATLPVLVYLGIANGGDQAIFLVSKDVSGITGEGTCFPDPSSCQLLGLSEGGGADLVYPPAGKTYRIEVASIDRELRSRPND